jgi:O-antigen/teichoic acid export membrane protein
MKALSVPATLGLERLLVREVATYRARSDWASWRGLLIWARRTLLAASVGIALVAVAVSWLVAGGGEGLRAFWLAMSLLPLLALLRLRQFILQGIDRAVAGQIPEMLVQPLLLIPLVAGYYACFGRMTAAGAMGLNVAATLAALVCSAVLLDRALPASVKEAAPNAQPRVWMRSAVPLLLVSGVNSVSGQIPVLMLGFLRNAEPAGIMSVAKRLSDLTIIPTLAFGTVLAPTLAALWAARDMRGLQRALTQWSRGVSFVALPLALVFIVFGRPLLEVFGAPFATGKTALAILCVGQIVSMFAGANGLLLVTAGHEREVAFISITCALLNFGLCASLIPRWGMAGAAAGAAAGLIVWNLWLAWRAWRLLGIRPTVFAGLAERPHEVS